MASFDSTARGAPIYLRLLKELIKLEFNFFVLLLQRALQESIKFFGHGGNAFAQLAHDGAQLRNKSAGRCWCLAQVPASRFRVPSRPPFRADPGLALATCTSSLAIRTSLQLNSRSALVQLPGTRLQSGVHPHPRSPICRGSGVHPHHHPRFAGDRGSSPSPVPIGSVPCSAGSDPGAQCGREG